MSNKKQSYLSAFVKSGLLIHTLLFTALACTLIVLGYACGLWGFILTNPKVLIITSVTVGLFALLALVYIVASANKQKIGITDALAFAVTLTALFFLFFMIFGLNGYNTRRVLTVVATFAIGLALVVTNACKFNPDKSESAQPQKNTICNYYKAIFSKYSFFSILCVAVVCVSFAVLFFLPNFVFGLVKNEYLYLGFLAIPFICWVGYSATSKQIGAFDALLIALMITTPIVLVLCILSKANQTLNLCVWAAAVLAGLALTLFRYLTFDVNYKRAEKPVNACNPLTNYVKRVFNKYNPLLILSTGALLTASIFVLFPVGSASSMIKVTQSGISFSPALLLVLAVQFTSISALFVTVLFGCTNLFIKEINVADFLILSFLVFVVLSGIDLFIVFSIKKLAVLLVGLLFAVVTVFARARAVCKCDK